jgi:hypothetical protein
MRTDLPASVRHGHRAATCRARPAIVAAALALAPLAAAAEEVERSPAAPDAEVVAEALFLYDPLPAGSHDVNFSLGIEEGEPDPITGEADLVASPRLQIAAPLGERLGFTLDVGLDTVGTVALDTPGAALKLLLREAGPGRTGLAASLDLYGSTHSLGETEVGLGLGALRGVGPLGLRAAVSVASGVTSFTPHLHTGASAALALGDRFRVLAEVTADVSSDEVAIGAGPTLKIQLGPSTAFMAGALLDLRPGAALPVFAVQLTQSM